MAEAISWRGPSWWRLECQLPDGLRTRHPRSGWKRGPEWSVDGFLEEDKWNESTHSPWWKQQRGLYVKSINQALDGPPLPEEWRNARCWRRADLRTKPWRERESAYLAAEMHAAETAADS